MLKSFSPNSSMLATFASLASISAVLMSEAVVVGLLSMSVSAMRPVSSVRAVFWSGIRPCLMNC